MFTDQKIEIAIVGHAIAHIGGRGLFGNLFAVILLRRTLAGNVGENQKLFPGMPDRSFGKCESRSYGAHPGVKLLTRA